MKPKEAENAVSHEDANGVQGPMKRCGAVDLMQIAGSAQRLVAKLVLRILSRATGDVVGYVYEWNNGERPAMWTAGRLRAIQYAPLTV